MGICLAMSVLRTAGSRPLLISWEAPNTFGNAGTLTVRNPGIRNFDFGLQKRFYLSERRYVEFRAKLSI